MDNIQEIIKGFDRIAESMDAKDPRSAFFTGITIGLILTANPEKFANDIIAFKGES